MKDDIRNKAVRAVSVAVARASRRLKGTIDAEMSLVDDLGIDSIRFVDLAFALEDALGVAPFPMQRWVDDETNREGKRFTVGSLVDRCEQCLRLSARG